MMSKSKSNVNHLIFLFVFFILRLSFVSADESPAGWAGVAHVSEGVAAEKEGGTGPTTSQAAEQADRPASARDIIIDICGDLEQGLIITGSSASSSSS